MIKLLDLILEQEDYRGSHQAPGRNDVDSPLHDVSNALPDFYDSTERELVRWYGSGYSYDALIVNTIKRYHNRPNNLVTIYRSVPKDVDVADINPGDWVSLSRQYVIDHGRSHLNGKYNILSKRVKASDVFTEGYIQEWGYDPL